MGGGESGPMVKAACIVLVSDSAQIFWKAAAVSAAFCIYLDYGTTDNEPRGIWGKCK